LGHNRRRSGFNIQIQVDDRTDLQETETELPVAFFYSDTENGIKTQVWCTLIVHLLLNVIQTINKSKKAFSTIAALVRIHLISHLDLTWIVTEGRRAYHTRTKSKNKSPCNVQLALF